MPLYVKILLAIALFILIGPVFLFMVWMFLGDMLGFNVPDPTLGVVFYPLIALPFVGLVLGITAIFYYLIGKPKSKKDLGTDQATRLSPDGLPINKLN